MGWLLFRWLVVMLIGVALSILGATWIVYTGWNVISMAILLPSLLSLAHWWTPLVIGGAAIVQWLWNRRLDEGQRQAPGVPISN